MKLCSILIFGVTRGLNVDSTEKPLPEELDKTSNDRWLGSAFNFMANHALSTSYFGAETCESQVKRLKRRDDCNPECGTNYSNYKSLMSAVKSRPFKYSTQCRQCVQKLDKSSAQSWRNAMFHSGGYKWGQHRQHYQNIFYLTDYGDKAHCYHKFATECKYGVRVWIKEMRIEAKSSASTAGAFASSALGGATGTTDFCPYDYIAFGYERNGQKFYPGKQHRFCGCLEDSMQRCSAIKDNRDTFNLKNVFSKTGCKDGCKWSPNYPREYWYSRHVPKRESYNSLKPTFNVMARRGRSDHYIAINGRNPTFTFKSDGSLHGGEVAVEWDCMSRWLSTAIVRYNLNSLGGIPRRQSRTAVLNDMKAALQNDLQLINPYGDTADTGETVVKVTLSDDESKVQVEIEFAGVRDEDVVLDKTVLVQKVSKTSQKTLSTDQFNQFVDASKIDAKVQLPPTVTNTEQMAASLLTGSFTPAMAEDYGCSSQGYFDAFSPTIGKARDDTDAAFYKWKKCVQCATGNDKFKIDAYDYDEDEQVCRGENRALCECDLALMTFLQTAEPFNGHFDSASCSVADHQNPTKCCNWQQHYWAVYNPDRQDCDEIEGVKEAGTGL